MFQNVSILYTKNNIEFITPRQPSGTGRRTANQICGRGDPLPWRELFSTRNSKWKITLKRWFSRKDSYLNWASNRKNRFWLAKVMCHSTIQLIRTLKAIPPRKSYNHYSNSTLIILKTSALKCQYKSTNAGKTNIS